MRLSLFLSRQRGVYYTMNVKHNLTKGGSKPPDWINDLRLATQGSHFGAVLTVAFHWPVAKGWPAFDGRATLSSDGFLLCNFTEANGSGGHPGAFVGSLADLCRNLAGVAAHLALTVGARETLARVVADWIGSAYQPGYRETLAAACSGKPYSC
jgi:hypothetical protein